VTIVDIREYSVNPRETINLVFQRSRPNLPVSLSIDDGPFRPVLNEFVAHMPADAGTRRKILVMTVGETQDNCRVTIFGESGPSDVDNLTVAGIDPVASARYRFTV